MAYYIARQWSRKLLIVPGMGSILGNRFYIQLKKKTSVVDCFHNVYAITAQMCEHIHYTQKIETI